MKTKARLMCVSLIAGATLQILAAGARTGCTTSANTADSSATKVLSADGLAVKSDIKVEYGEGHGETVEEALQDAMNDVLRKVVGVYVDSDFRMENDKIIKDEIITHSNGFIDRYKKMEVADDPNGRGKVVTIKAWVNIRDFVNRMKKIGPRQTVRMDGALLNSDISNSVNAETLLRKEFEKLDPILDLMDIDLVSSVRPEIQSSSDDTVVLRYAFQIHYSKDKYYRQFVRRVGNLLDQISTKKTKRSVPFRMAKINYYPRTGNGEYWKTQQVSAYYLLDQVDLNNAMRQGTSAWNSKSKLTISIVQSVSRGGSAIVREWTLTEHLKRVFDEIRKRYYQNNRSVRCAFRVMDENGQELSCAVQNISLSCLQDIYFGIYFEKAPDFIPFMKCDTSGMPSDSCKSCSALTNRNGGSYRGYVNKYIGCIDITIDKKSIKKIKSAEIRLETNNQGGN